MRCVISKISAGLSQPCPVTFATLWIVSSLCDGQLEPTFAVADGPKIATATSNFVLRLSRSSYFNKSFLEEEDPVRFIPSMVGRPDLPPWLLFTQRDLQSDGFLYGTPQGEEDSTSLQVIAINKNSQTSSRRTLNITVESKSECSFHFWVHHLQLSRVNRTDGMNIPGASERARFTVELKVLNLDVEEILEDGVLRVLLQRVQQVWNTENNYVTKVLSLRDVGARLPVPSKPGVVPKEGVVIQIGGYNDFSLEMKNTAARLEKAERCGAGDAASAETALFGPEFHIDWCAFKLISVWIDVRTGEEASC